MHVVLKAIVEVILAAILPRHVYEDWFGDPWRAGERRAERKAAREKRRLERRAYRKRLRERRKKS